MLTDVDKLCYLELENKHNKQPDSFNKGMAFAICTGTCAAGNSSRSAVDSFALDYR